MTGGPSVPVNIGNVASLPEALSVIVTFLFVSVAAAEGFWLIRSILFGAAKALAQMQWRNMVNISVCRETTLKMSTFQFLEIKSPQRL